MNAPQTLITPARRVLLIDDEAGTTALCRWILERSGRYVVREENNPFQALATAKYFRPKLILLDHHMPGKSGDAIAAECAADLELRRVPILVLTGDADAARARDSGCVLLKPVRAEKLLEACAKLVSSEVR